jgi:DMSO/TMAO reductase YedYZ molybdopterin-dependent catalytic subunit
MLKKINLVIVILYVISTLGLIACTQSLTTYSSSSSTITSSFSSTTTTTSTSTTSSTITLNPAGEVEATEFMGTQLTPINGQMNNGIQGTINIDRATYRLVVDGLVNNPLSLSYDDLMAYPQISKLMDLNCVESWNFTAKWTGPALTAIFNEARVKPEAKIAIFYTPEGPHGFTSLDLGYIQEKNIIVALKDNDITLPPERGFPFQVVAESKYGYKWVKWVIRIELSSDTTFRGYWESGGYNNNADVSGPKTEH